MRRNLLILVFALAAFAVADDYGSREWLNDIAGGYLPYLKLEFNDFPVSDGVSAQELLNTQSFVHYSYKSAPTHDADGWTCRVTSITVRSGFDQNRSWKRTTFTETRALLAHEQGHLDIAELHAKSFAKATMPEGFGATEREAADDLSSRLESLCAKYADESKLEQDKYDVETHHGAAQEPQKQWTGSLRSRLDAAGITYWDRS